MMKTKTLILLIASHLSIGVLGFAIGIYALPILIAPPAPSDTEVQAMSSQALFSAEFKRDLKGSDTFHWGEGIVSLGKKYITLMGEVAPGPDYKLYLSPEYVETEAEFERIKHNMVHVGEVKTFQNFSVEVAENIDITRYNTVIVWCETFGEFITSAKYR